MPPPSPHLCCALLVVLHDKVVGRLRARGAAQARQRAQDHAVGQRGIAHRDGGDERRGAAAGRRMKRGTGCTHMLHALTPCMCSWCVCVCVCVCACGGSQGGKELPQCCQLRQAIIIRLRARHVCGSTAERQFQEPYGAPYSLDANGGASLLSCVARPGTERGRSPGSGGHCAYTAAGGRDGCLHPPTQQHNNSTCNVQHVQDQVAMSSSRHPEISRRNVGRHFCMPRSNA